MANQEQRSKVEEPVVPPMANDANTLVAEYKVLSAALLKANQDITGQQQTITQAQAGIEDLKTRGFQVVGQLNVIRRLLAGMNVDPNKYVADAAPEEMPIYPDFVPEMEAEEAEVVAVEEDTPSPAVSAIRNRLRR